MSAIATILHYREELPALVMLPAALARQWKAELLQHASEVFSPDDICLITKSSDVVKGKVALVPYTLIDKMSECGHLRPDQFGIVIADECHNLKNPEAKRTEICIPFLKHAKVAIGLSGTPVVNRPKEIFTVLSALLPRIFCSYGEFIQRYCDAKKVSYGKGIDDTGASNLHELAIVLEGIIMVRRLKSVVVASLPKKSREKKYIAPDPKYVHQLRTIQGEMDTLKKQLMEAMGSRDEGNIQRLKGLQQQQINRYKLVTGLSKAFGVCNIVKDMIKQLKAQGKMSIATGDSKPSGAAVAPLNEFSVAEQATTLAEPDMDMDVEFVGVTDLSKEESMPSVPGASTPMYGGLEDDILMDGAVEEVKGKKASEKMATAASAAVFVPDEDDIAILDSDDERPDKGGRSFSRLKRLKHSPDAAQNVTTPSRKKTVETSGRRSLRSSDKKSNAPAVGKYAEDSDSDDLFFLEPGAGTRNKKSTPIASQKRSRLDECEGFDSYSDEEDMFGGADRKAASSAAASTEWKKILGGDGKGKKDLAQGKKKIKKDTTGIGMDSPKLVRKNRLPEKIIIFAYHREVMDMIEDTLRDIDVDYIRLDGSSTTSSRNISITDFQYRDMADVALLSLKACGTGLNLTAASTALFAELDWSPATIFQAEDRIHRIGQKAAAVKIIFAVCENSADDIIWQQLQKKHSIVEDTVGASGNGGQISIHSHNREAITGQTTLNFSAGAYSSQPSHHKNASQSSPGEASGSGEAKRAENVYQSNKPIPQNSTKVQQQKPASPSSGKGGISQYLSQPRAPSSTSVYGTKSPEMQIADIFASAISGAKTSAAGGSKGEAVSLVNDSFSEIPMDLIEQQFKLADEMAAKRKLPAQPSSVPYPYPPPTAPSVAPSRGQGGDKKHEHTSVQQQQQQLLQAIHVESSQFDYPSSQPSDVATVADNTRPSPDKQRGPLLNVPYGTSVVDSKKANKPSFGWSLAPSASVYGSSGAAHPAPQSDAPRTGGSLPSSAAGTGRTDYAAAIARPPAPAPVPAPVPASAPAPAGAVFDENARQQQQQQQQQQQGRNEMYKNKAIVPSSSVYAAAAAAAAPIAAPPPAKVLDEATLLRIEENKKKALLRLQQQKLTNAMPVSAAPRPVDRQMAIVSPPEVKPAHPMAPAPAPAPQSVGSAPNPYAGAFSTGKGRAVPITEAAMEDAKRLKMFNEQTTNTSNSSRYDAGNNVPAMRTSGSAYNPKPTYAQPSYAQSSYATGSGYPPPAQPSMAAPPVVAGSVPVKPSRPQRSID
jgi:SNF2 family DNA or RNA helicase